MVDDEAEYRRGHVAGGIAERLDNHDRHFAKINGSIDRVGDELRQLNLTVQGLRDQMAADQRTVVTTAVALEKADAARRDKSESSWSPFSRVLALIGGAVAVIGLIVTLLLK